MVNLINLYPIPSINPKRPISNATPTLPKSTIICPRSVGVTVTSLLQAINLPTIILGPNGLPGIELASILPCNIPKLPEIWFNKFKTFNVKSALFCNVANGFVLELMASSFNDLIYPIPMITITPNNAPIITSQTDNISP